ncbi:MAG: hypothetical protein EXQ85_05500 [Alphaproteobacteria bacterium]|nr:hypothetical protein [Alphaproteobacteria bacterium]
MAAKGERLRKFRARRRMGRPPIPLVRAKRYRLARLYMPPPANDNAPTLCFHARRLLVRSATAGAVAMLLWWGLI